MDVYHITGTGPGVQFLVYRVVVVLQRAQRTGPAGSMGIVRSSNAVAVGSIIIGALVVIGVWLFLRPHRLR